jgi:hypothetical protein
MFICKECLEKEYLNPMLSFRSFGCCEYCKENKSCIEIQERNLMPKIKSVCPMTGNPKTTNQTSDEINRKFKQAATPTSPIGLIGTKVLYNEFKPNQNNMEKQIKMSLETAQKLYNNAAIKNGSDSEQNKIIREWILENFTQKELEGKKGFTWEDSFCNSGYYIDNTSHIVQFNQCVISSRNVNVFKTKEQAESALAFAQLTHIVAKMNGPMNDNLKTYTIYRVSELTKELNVKNLYNQEHGVCYGFYPLTFISEDLAKTSLVENYDLWAKYWML